MNFFQATNSIVIITVENNSFSISAPSFWSPEDGEEPINERNKLLELGSENDIELYVKEVEKRSTRINIENSDYNLAGFDHFNCKILAGLKKVKYGDLEDMVYRMELTYNEIVDISDVKYVVGSNRGYSLQAGVFETSDFDLMINFLLPNKVKVKMTIDDSRLKSNLTTNKTISFTKRSFFYTIWEFSIPIPFH